MDVINLLLTESPNVNAVDQDGRFVYFKINMRVMMLMISAIGRVPHLRPGYWMHSLQYINDFLTEVDFREYYPILRSRL